jgi:hypothetical protein
VNTLSPSLGFPHGFIPYFLSYLTFYAVFTLLLPYPRSCGCRNVCSSSKVKVKLLLSLTKHHAMKTYWGSGGIAPLIPDLGTISEVITVCFLIHYLTVLVLFLKCQVICMVIGLDV